MTLKRISALALTGVLTLSALAGCAPKNGGETTPPPASTPPATSTPAPTDTVKPSETPLPEESATPAPTDTPTAAPSESTKPTESAKPSEKPSAKPSEKPSATPAPTPAPTPKPTPAPAPEKSVVQSIWGDISSWELPSLMDLDDATLSDLYGISSGDLVEYVAKMPMISANITEFLIAKVAPGKMDSVKKACEARQATLAGGVQYPANMEYVEDYKLVTSGDYIIFAIDEKAADMVTAFNKYAK